MPEFDDTRLKTPAGKGVLHQVSVPSTPVREAAAATAGLATEALLGETVTVFDAQDGYAHVQCDRDRYVGWIAQTCLSPAVAAPSHKVCTPLTHGYAEPDLKSPGRTALSLGARVLITGQEGDWRDCGDAGWLHTRHLAPVEVVVSDPVDTAECLLGTPYVWGGRQSTGLDCTGLTQQCFETAGILLPRDSDMQYGWCGATIDDWQRPGALQRGDLVLWKGHVGIMADQTHLIHANAWHMAVAKEPLAEAIERIANYYAEPIGARRIDVSIEAGAEPAWLSRLKA